jgi:hypothetical protein
MAKPSKSKTGRKSTAAIAAAAAVEPESPGLVALIFGRSGATLTLTSETFTLQAMPGEFDAPVATFVDAKAQIVAQRSPDSKQWHLTDAKGLWALRNADVAELDE